MKKYVLKPLGYLLIGLLTIAVIGAGTFLAYRTYKQSEIREATRIKTPDGVESLEKIEVNGSQQWIYIRGQNRSNPVLLFVHGGPGVPEMTMARHMGLRLEKYFTVVHWDQRASGKSRGEAYDDADLNIATYLEDTLQVINFLRRRFNQDKIYLIGHSWGTVLGVLTVRDHPELFHAYIGMGQMVNAVRNEEVSLEYVQARARAEGNTEALEQLENLNPPYDKNPDELRIQRRWLNYYGGQMKGTAKAVFNNNMMYCPEYSIRDIFSMVKGMNNLAFRMWPELSSVDLITQAPKLDVPVYFFTGRYDYNTPFTLTEEYYDVLEAPSKQIVWFENSSHMMNISDPDRYQDILINKVLAETRLGAGLE